MTQRNFCYIFPGREAVSKGLDNSFYCKFPEAKNAVEQASNFLEEDLYCMGYLSKEIPVAWQTVLLVTH